MYTPDHFQADDADALILRLAKSVAGILVTMDADGAPTATHIPVLWDAKTRTARGHIARANPQWKTPGKGLIILSGAEAYVSPSLYPSKAEHHKAVPTWNYEAVHLTGAVEFFEDAARLEDVVRDLAAFHEADRAQPWTLSDAPRPYIDAMLRGIVGVELRAERIEAKHKLSQNKSEADFDGVAAGLAASDAPMALEIAALMRQTRSKADEPQGN